MSSYTRMETWSLLVPHGPLSMVHSNTVSPTDRPLATACGSVASLSVACPLITLHNPVAGPVGAFAFRFTVLAAPQTEASCPAFATGASAS